jgi:hypothetical protein
MIFTKGQVQGKVGQYVGTYYHHTLPHIIIANHISDSDTLSLFRSPDGTKPINWECSFPDAASGSFRGKLKSFRTRTRAWITRDLNRCEQGTLTIK